MPHKHNAYHIVDEQFKSFVTNSREFLKSLPMNHIVNILATTKKQKDTMGGLYVINPPFNVTYIGKIADGGGDAINFFNENQELIYTYYDTE